MLETALPPAARNKKNVIILRRFLAGAVPPLAASIIGLWQLLQPFVPHDHVGMLYIAMVACWVAPMAVGVWCKVDAVERAAAERDAALAAQIDRLGDALVDNQTEILDLLNQLQRSLKGLHCRIERSELARDEETKELEHLRQLVIGDVVTIPDHQRLGPRSLS